jgi:hypothetical protein
LNILILKNKKNYARTTLIIKNKEIEITKNEVIMTLSDEYKKNQKITYFSAIKILSIFVNQM